MSLYNKIIDRQKLAEAWKRVRANKPAAGIDEMTWTQFDTGSGEELKKLYEELAGHTYTCKPVKVVILYKDGKERQIALYSMRDKVVQQSLAQEIGKIFANAFSDRAFAYRENKSALNAINEIETEAKSGKYSWLLKIDIHHFFDSIRWDQLSGMLRRRITENDVLNLIREECLAPSVDKEGNLVKKTVGIHQGSSIAPVLSNIYLSEFDRWVAVQDVFYVRYSDDMLLLGQDHEKMKALLAEIQTRLEALGLSLSEKKTEFKPLTEGVEFLGYGFDDKGKIITAKAEEKLTSRLETAWLLHKNKSCRERLIKLTEILNGWEQYFRGARKIGDILEYTAVVFMVRSKEELGELADKRPLYENIYPEIAEYLAEVWEDMKRPDLVLLEYEQRFGFYEEESWRKLCRDKNNLSVLTGTYRELVTNENEENYVELMQTYADCHAFSCATKVSEKISLLKAKKVNAVVGTEAYTRGAEGVHFTESAAEKFAELFAGREDMYAVIDYDGNRKVVQPELQPLTKTIAARHLAGNYIAATYVQRPNATVRFLVIDIDVSKKILLECAYDREKLEPYIRKAANAAAEIGDWFKKRGVRVRFEFSGFRGYHVWLFLDAWVPTYHVNNLTDIIEREFADKFGNEISIEFFPNKMRMKPDKPGQCIKLPCGVRSSSGVRSVLLMDDFTEADDIEKWIDGTVKYPLTVLKKITAAERKAPEDEAKREMDTDLSCFGELAPNIDAILKNCSLMRYLCRKAHDSGYLTHFERLSVLYVFGHVGEEGKRFIHQVMSYTLNYKYNVTEKFVRKCPEKPVSCVKLRDQYKRVTAEFGCSCYFKRGDKCYPSPVLHAITSSKDESEEVTLPVSETLTKEKSAQMSEELNIHKKAQSLAVRIVELKKQKRGLDNSIRKVEKELERLFDEAKVDELELEMGLLVRRKKDIGYEWVIEI